MLRKYKKRDVVIITIMVLVIIFSIVKIIVTAYGAEGYLGIILICIGISWFPRIIYISYTRHVNSIRDKKRIKEEIEINIMVHDHLDKGWILYKEDKFEEALNELLEAEILDGNNIQVLQSIAIVKFLMDENESAVKWLSECINLDPKRASSHLGLGYVFQKLSLHELAVAEFMKASMLLGFEHKNEQAHIMTLMSYSKACLGDYSGAYDKLRLAYYINPMDPFVSEHYGKGIKHIQYLRNCEDNMGVSHN